MTALSGRWVRKAAGPCGAGQPRAQQSRALAHLPCPTRLFPADTTLCWGDLGSSSLRSGAAGSGEEKPGLQFPISAGSYLPEKSQAKGSAISFPTQGSGRERREVRSEPWISLLSPAGLCTTERLGKAGSHLLQGRVVRAGCEAALQRQLCSGDSRYGFVLVPGALFKNQLSVEGYSWASELQISNESWSEDGLTGF